MKASENIACMVYAFPDKERKDAVRALAERVKAMEQFIADVDKSYDCDTGANGSHPPPYCRKCRAQKLTEENQ